MSPVASPPPIPTRVEELEEQLDANIAQVRAEIEKLRKERSRLSAAVLSSTKVQEHLKSKQQQSNRQTEQGPLKTLATAQDQHNETNIHRLAFGVTAFPFTDPAPENKGQPPLLGVRFDIPTKDGKFNGQPYYVFLKRAAEHKHADANEDTSEMPVLQIHHHTIPSHIDIDSLATRYLPTPAGLTSNPDFMSVDGEYENTQDRRREDSSFDDSGIEIATKEHRTQASESQSVHLFTSHLRTALTSFHLRADAASYLAEALNVRVSTNSEDATSTGLYSVQSLSAPDPDARHIRIVWSDGSLGRLKINDEGLIERAVVFGGEHNRRLPEAERTLMHNDQGEVTKVQDLVQRLKICHERQYWGM